MQADRISGYLGSRKLDYNVPTYQGGFFGSPTQSYPKNMILSTENIHSNSDDIDMAVERTCLNQGKLLWISYQLLLQFFRIIRTTWI